MNAIPQDLNRQQRQRRWRALVHCSLPVLLAFMVSAGCKQKTEASADIDPAGTYTLVNVDGNQVPCTLTHQGHAMAVQSGIFIIKADGTCSSEVAFSVESGEQVSREVKATYTLEGSTLSMNWEGAGTTTGTVEGDTFTMNNEGMVFSYRK